MNVVFEEEKMPRYSAAPSYGITGWLIRNHCAHNIKQAQIILVVLALVLFGATGTVLKKNISKNKIDTHSHFVPAVIIKE